MELDDRVSRKKYEVCMVLCLFFGIFGLHRFYVGKWLTGILWLCTGGLFFVGWIIDVIMLGKGEFTDSRDRYLKSEPIQEEEVDVVEISFDDLHQDLELPLDEYDEIRIEIEK